MRQMKQTTLEVAQNGFDAIKILALRNGKLEEELEELKARSIATPIEISTDVTSRPRGEIEKVPHEQGVVVGIKELPDGRFKFRGEDVEIEGVRTVRGGGVFDTLAEAILHQNKVLESLFVLGLIDEARLVRRRR